MMKDGDVWIPDVGAEQIVFQTIVDALADDIGTGRLKPGQQLPPQRALAIRIGVKLSVVSRAYQEASRRRLIGGEIGRGTYVLPAAPAATLFPRGHGKTPSIDLARNVPAFMPGDVDLANAVASLTPVQQLQAGGYQSAEMIENARRAIEIWLAGRGVFETPPVIIPCAGAQAALQAVLAARTRPGDSVLVEAFTSPDIRIVAGRMQLRLVAVEQDNEGILPGALSSAVRTSGARIAVVVPNLQNPTGTVMGDARRAAIAAIAREKRLLVVEDDVYGPLSGRPPLYDALGGNGILVSSLSKTVLPGLRFGYVAGSHEHLTALANDIQGTTSLMSPLALLIGCQWITDGTASARVERQRREIAERWAMMREILGETGAPPAPHAWLTIDGDPEEAVLRCRALGVEVVPATSFAAGRRSAARIGICLTAAVDRAQLRVALTFLREIGARP